MEMCDALYVAHIQLFHIDVFKGARSTCLIISSYWTKWDLWNMNLIKRKIFSLPKYLLRVILSFPLSILVWYIFYIFFRIDGLMLHQYT